MNPFQYATAATPDEAVSLVGKNGRYLGGGIDLLGEMKDYIVSPDILVDVKSVSVPLVNWNSATQELPSTMTVEEIATAANLKELFPGLCEAASEVGSPQIRHVATLAGNLLQHSRCWYYRQPDIVCLKRGGTTCYGQDGENKYLSLFSGCACISPIVSNLAVALTALNATAVIQNVGSRSIPDLYKSAWENPAAHNSLDPHDFLLKVIVPALPDPHDRSAYRQVSEKSEFDWALVSCAAAGHIAHGILTNARVVLGAVAPIPYMVEEANRFLEGKPLTDDTASKAADLILKDAKPLAHNGYKIPIAHTLIRRTLLALNP